MDSVDLDPGAREQERRSGEVLEAFARGAIRKELGLEISDLRIGLDLARAHLRRGATAEATRICATLVLCEPMQADFQIALCDCALLGEEYHVALQAASAVVALCPTDPRGYLLSGRACLALGYRTEAIEDLRDAIAFAKEAQSLDLVREAGDLLSKLEYHQVG